MRLDVSEPGSEVVYTSEVAWQHTIDHALVVCCSEPRIHRAVEEFLSRNLGLGAADRVILPAGPQRTLPSGSFFFAVRDDIVVLHRAHDLKRVVGIAHHDCYAYAQLYSSLDQAARRERQEADLRQFAREVDSFVPGAQVELYYAEPSPDGRVQFTAIREA